MTQHEPIQVKCYAGYRANEAPREFICKGRHHNIVEIVDRWYEGGVKPRQLQLDYYKVKVDDGRQYIIRYNHLFDNWVLITRLKDE